MEKTPVRINESDWSLIQPIGFHLICHVSNCDSSSKPCHQHQDERRNTRILFIGFVEMVLKLRELLIKQVAIHLAYLPGQSCQRLTADQRERVIHWLASHDCLSYKLLPYITRNLLSVPLHSLEFYKCDQLTNDMLIEFARSNHFSRLKSLIIHQCKQVHGNEMK